MKRLIAITPAFMARKSTKDTPNKSLGLRPMTAAIEAIPALVFSGSINRELGALESIKIGELGSLNWSAKSEGGLYSCTRNGHQCLEVAFPLCARVTSINDERGVSLIR